MEVTGGSSKPSWLRSAVPLPGFPGILACLIAVAQAEFMKSSASLAGETQGSGGVVGGD
jgi:hypothetical protein